MSITCSQNAAKHTVGINDIETAFSFGRKTLKATKKNKKLHDDIVIIIDI